MMILNGVRMLILFFSKASSRLHFLKVLKRCSLSTSDLLFFYTSAVRPLLEYAALRGIHL